MTEALICRDETFRGDAQSAGIRVPPAAGKPSALEDVQNHEDDRQVSIDHVGVSDLCYPITVLDRSAESQRTIATITLSVGLPHDTPRAST